MKGLFPIPEAFFEDLRRGAETGIGYKVASVGLKDGRRFDQVVVSECYIIEVRGYSEIPFAPYDVATVSINHDHWNFRDASDSRSKCRSAIA